MIHSPPYPKSSHLHSRPKLKIMYFIHRPLKVSSLLIIFGGSLCFPLLQTSVHLPDPVPVPWPEQFHSILFVNTSKGKLWKTDLWYDWPNGRNFNINQHQLGKLLYNLEWDNGTSFFYTLDSNQECTVMHFEVGILRPNWLDGATYIGQKSMDGFLCNVWEKADFLWYYEDVGTKQPVLWEFYSGAVSHVMTFEVGRVLEDPNWQAPQYCFKDAIPKAETKHVPVDRLSPGGKVLERKHNVFNDDGLMRM